MKLSEWKSLEITQVIFTELKARQAQLKDELGESAGESPLNDRLKVGAIKAYQDLLDIEVQEEALND